MLINSHSVGSSLRVARVALGCIALLVLTSGFSNPTTPTTVMPLNTFPIQHYDQNIAHWLRPTQSNYTKPLLSAHYQQQRLQEFYQYRYGSDANGLSPWSASYVTAQLHRQPVPHESMEQAWQTFDNRHQDAEHTGYASNFHPYNTVWIDSLHRNVDAKQLHGLSYQPLRRAITVAHTHARQLPTDEPFFYSPTLAGEGFPFDVLQVSAVWAGTPVYILAETRDKAWSYVLIENFAAWLPTQSLARVSNDFIARWQHAARKHMIAITHTQTSIIDSKGQFQFSAYVGSVFPLLAQQHGRFKILIPRRDAQGAAQISTAELSSQHAVRMPWAFTPQHVATLIKTLINRPYGWGGLYFYNDCSQELKSLFTPFGLWIARNSADQLMAGRVDDKSELDTNARLAYLTAHGHPLLSIVYIGGHVLLYLGNYSLAGQPQPVAMSYQNVWGLAPADRSSRSVIGQATLLPLLNQYPEDKSLASLASKKYFRIIHLDEWPKTTEH